jgi:replicative DNA helicase
MSLLPKRSIFQVLGCLMQKPSLMDEDRYDLIREDFYEEGESNFYVILFACINNLYRNGLEQIDIISIDSFLSQYESQYRVFNDNQGIEYLQTAMEQSNLANFDYNYNVVKKFSLLRTYKKMGFSIKDIYDETIIDLKEQESMIERFHKMSIEDIIEHFEQKQIKIRNMFASDKNKITQHASEGAEELIERFKQTPDYGVSLIGKLQNTIFRGAKLKTVTLRSAPQNLGKTRIALAEATDMAVDEIYDPHKGKWVYNNKGENVLYISTEMEAELLQPTILAYISAVPEEKIKDGLCSDEEFERVKKAVEVLERSNFWIEYIPNFNTNQIETIIKTHILENKAQYIFFDYIHISTQILLEMADMSKGMNMREDMVLYMFMFRLVQLAERYNVYIKTASQLNGEWKNAKDGDQNLLRGAKSLADKIHMGMIALAPTQKDLEAIEPILHTGIYPVPNVVYHIYKNRMTKYKGIKLWLYIDYDTMRVTELFATTNDYQLINIQPTELKTKEFDF